MKRRPPPGMPRKLIGALDIGSSKVSALIADPGEGGVPRVLGTGQRESRGVKRGFIVDMEMSEIAVRAAVEQAERIAGTQIEAVFVSFSAGGFSSDIATVEVETGGRQIEQPDLDSLLEAGRSSIEPGARMILHANPALYTVDGVAGVRNPRELFADRLGVSIHVISAEPAPIRNLDLCVRSAHLGVDAIIASPVAAGKACLSEEERELGVALVELGAGVTNVSVFAGGVLVGLKSIPLGGGDITDDIAAVFGTRRIEAERIKCFHGSAMTSARDNHETIELSPIAGGQEGVEAVRATRAQLVSVIRQRLEQITGEVEKALKEFGFAGPFGRQVVLTGGGAELKAIADYVQGILGRAVRVGRPLLEGLPDAHAGPAFATVVGLALVGASEDLDLRPGQSTILPEIRSGGNLIQRFASALRGQY